MTQSNKVVVVDDTTILCGPFVWKREDNGGCECWDCVFPEDLKIARFCVKNYGVPRGKLNPDNAFSGWRVVGGGPFTSAGQWRSRDAAILGGTEWLIGYYKRAAHDEMERATRLVAALGRLLDTVEAA